jgi:methionyl-tRNA formyltransferase
MRLVFAGTPVFAQNALAALHASGHDIALVLTQPDRPAGRGMQLQASAVKQYAQQHGMPVCQPSGMRLDGKYPDEAAAAQVAIAQTGADAMVVVAYGLLLPTWALHSVPMGCLNIHASLLPRWRGAAPIQRAVEAGDAQSGVCIMQMEEGLDTGPVLWRQALTLAEHETSASLHDKLADLGATGIVQTLAQLPNLSAVAQPEDGVTYAAKIDKHEALINWSLAASVLARRIRAFDPFPGAHTLREGQTLKIWSAQALSQAANQPPGTVLQASGHGLDVACGEGVLRLLQLQKPGGKRLAFAELLRGQADWQGSVLGH